VIEADLRYQTCRAVFVAAVIRRPAPLMLALQSGILGQHRPSPRDASSLVRLCGRGNLSESKTPAALLPLAFCSSRGERSVVVAVSVPDRLAEVDVVLVGQGAGGTARCATKQGTAQEIAARDSTGCRPCTCTDTGAAQATLEPCFTACGEPEADQESD
jgi:hypothetical protein